MSLDVLVQELDYPKLVVVEGYDCVGKDRIIQQVSRAYEREGMRVTELSPDWASLDSVLLRNDRWIVCQGVLSAVAKKPLPYGTVLIMNRSTFSGYLYYQMEFERFGLVHQSKLTMDQVREGLAQFTDTMNRARGAMIFVRPSEEDFLKMAEKRGASTVDEANTGASLLTLYRTWYALADQVLPVVSTSFNVVEYANLYED